MFKQGITIIGLILYISSFKFTSGFEAYFPLSTITMTIPIFNETIKIFDKQPIIQLNAVNFNSNNKNVYNYKIEENNNMLKIDENTGDVWLDRNFTQLHDNSTLFIISAEYKPGVSTATNSKTVSRVTLKILPKFLNTKNYLHDFCANNIESFCFYDNILYTTVEDDDNNVNKIFLKKKIGEIGPKYLYSLCKNYIINYNLINATEYVQILQNILYSNNTFDHDIFKPGPNLIIEVQCNVKILNQILYRRKILHINILDKNDNSPYLQDNKLIDIYLDEPHFVKDKPIGRNSIMFLDNDSLFANTHILYEVINDTMEIIKPLCQAYETDHMGTKMSVISCKLLFARDGILRRSPYCIKLRASDATVFSFNYTEQIDTTMSIANICITSDLTKIHETDRPTALALQSTPPIGDTIITGHRKTGREKKIGRKFTWGAEDVQNGGDGTMKAVLKIGNFTYPSDVIVYRSATNLSRVTQPTKMFDLIKTSTKFKIIKDPIGAFGITQIGGIIYLQNVTALIEATENKFYLTIGWQKNTATILINIEEAAFNNNTCKNIEEKFLKPCSEMETKRDCNKNCGIGTEAGFCQWRANNFTGLLTTNYATCSPNLTTCPDNICDPLEQIAQSVEKYLCPQDCVKSDKIFGPHITNEMTKLGIYSASGICTCDDYGKCSCGIHTPPKNKIIKKIKSSTTSENVTPSLGLMEMAATMSIRDYNVSAQRASWDQFQCDAPCLALIVGCPLLLIIILLLLILSRRHFIKVAKRKTITNCTLNRSFNETETFNVEVPLVPITNTNDLNFKCDVNSKWEFNRQQLILDISLGEGEFGKVVKGYATDIHGKGGTSTVAVKMIKNGANSVELLALLSEFQLLQEVSHPNVIRLLGACTQGDTPLIIIEYCQFGSLRNYLRLSRKLECSGFEPSDGVEPITVKDILSFAWQICKGMAYLTEIKLVHRDLAARNVLLAEGKICKVSDFGLTRDVYEDDAYLKRSKDRVPVKWMAPESLADHVYTCRSDVWAFGVLAWELITLGASPYPGVPPQNLYHLLKSGYRLERPENCSEEIYSIIRSCWADEAAARPSFKHLASQWEKLLGRNAKYLEFDQNAVSNPFYCIEQNNFVEELESPTDNNNETDDLQHLWHAPNVNGIEVDNISDKNDGERTSSTTITTPSTIAQDFSPQTQHGVTGYDMPRPLIDSKNVEQKLRYENDVTLPTKLLKSSTCNSNNANTYINNPGECKISEPNLVSLSHYESPIKRGKSYIDMSSGVNGSQGGLSTGLSINLDTKNDEKKLSKDITFKFSSLLNLNEQMTSVM